MTFVKRRDAREAVLCMLFDYSFQSEEKPEDLLDMYIEHYYSEAEKNISEEIRELQPQKNDDLTIVTLLLAKND